MLEDVGTTGSFHGPGKDSQHDAHGCLEARTGMGRMRVLAAVAAENGKRVPVDLRDVFVRCVDESYSPDPYCHGVTTGFGGGGGSAGAVVFTNCSPALISPRVGSR